MTFSLDKSRRIRRNSEYKRVYDGGVRSSGRYLIAMMRPTEGPLRIGITVSRKVGNACVRSLVKRRIREAVRRELDPALFGWDLVLIAKGQGAPKRAGVADKAKGPGRLKGKGVDGAGGSDKTNSQRRAFYPFSGIAEDIRRIAGRLSGVKGELPISEIKGKGL
ncbi:MAG: ribonuclease P protein component [Nitrospirota bacterium]